ncbi:GFA family protein [Defluviimonas sp. SAOS-178_SWC]|uniref:GFA family protein n=1 Tax=Defluviimonas sp. SAOS-178_SWC TaxID=3121287 RepID=UPI00322206FC
MTGAKALSGQCLCGAVTVTMEARQPELHACHCDMCRRWTGSAFLEIDAAPGTIKAMGPVKVFTSSDWAERAHCDTCGTPLWYHLTVPGTDHYSVSAGLFDNLGGFALTKEIYVDQKPKGFAYAGDHLRQTKAEFMATIAPQIAGEEK